MSELKLFLVCSHSDCMYLNSSNVSYDLIFCFDSSSVSLLSELKIKSNIVYWIDIESYIEDFMTPQSFDSTQQNNSFLLTHKYYSAIYNSTNLNVLKFLKYLNANGLNGLHVVFPQTLVFDSRGHIIDIFKFLLVEHSSSFHIEIISVALSRSLASIFKPIISVCASSILNYFSWFLFRLRATYIMQVLKLTTCLFGSGIPAADSLYSSLPLFRLDYFQNQDLTGFYKKYLRTLRSNHIVLLKVCVGNTAMSKSCLTKYIESVSCFITKYSESMSAKTDHLCTCFAHSTCSKVILSDNLSLFTYLVIQWYVFRHRCASLSLIAHGKSRKENLWKILFQLSLPYPDNLNHFHDSTGVPDPSICLFINNHSRFLYYSYSHCKRGVVKFNPLYFDAFLLFIRSCQITSTFYVSRKSGSESSEIFSDFSQLPDEINRFEPSFKVNFTDYIVAIGHWGQAHTHKLLEGNPVLYFGSDPDQIPFGRQPITSISTDDKIIKVSFGFLLDSSLGLWLVSAPSET